MKKILFLLVIFGMFFTAGFAKDDLVKMYYEGFTWQQPVVAEELKESQQLYYPAISYFYGKERQGTKFEEGLVFTVITNYDYIQKTIQKFQDRKINNYESTSDRTSSFTLNGERKRLITSKRSGRVNVGVVLNFKYVYFEYPDLDKYFFISALFTDSSSKTYEKVFDKIVATVEIDTTF